MMSQKQVSVALATYNGEKFLPALLTSLLSQTHRIKEIVISDDCSTDSTKSILMEFYKRYPDLVVLYFNEKNLGFIKNFETAIRLCRYDYIALCDQDDLWDNNKVELLLEEITDSDLVYSDARLIDSSGGLIRESLLSITRQQSVENIVGIALRNHITGCTVLFRREMLTKAVPFPNCIPHDQWLAIVALDGRGIACHNDPLMSYRQHEGNTLGLSLDQDSKQKNNRVLGYKRRFKKFVQLNYRAAPILSNETVKKLYELKEYYASYFKHKIRIKACLFFIRNYKAMRGSKGNLMAMKDLIMSLAGQGRW